MLLKQPIWIFASSRPWHPFGAGRHYTDRFFLEWVEVVGGSPTYFPAGVDPDIPSITKTSDPPPSADWKLELERRASSQDSVQPRAGGNKSWRLSTCKGIQFEIKTPALKYRWRGNGSIVKGEGGKACGRPTSPPPPAKRSRMFRDVVGERQIQSMSIVMLIPSIAISIWVKKKKKKGRSTGGAGMPQTFRGSHGVDSRLLSAQTG